MFHQKIYIGFLVQDSRHWITNMQIFTETGGSSIDLKIMCHSHKVDVIASLDKSTGELFIDLPLIKTLKLKKYVKEFTQAYKYLWRDRYPQLKRIEEFPTFYDCREGCNDNEIKF